jgi:serine phosphatase RsbU (regulator of sigma subunit)
MPASIRGLEFSHLYRSATTATRVGGDFFDVFELTEGRVGVLMGDVSGKGLEAAVLTSIIKDTVKAYAHDTRSPAVAVKHANAALADAAGSPTFASLIYAVVDGARGLLTYCNAGHPPPVVLAADGSLRLLEGTSPVIGAFPGSAFAQRTVRLASDETVLLYTDGVTEARDPAGTFFEEQRLHAAVRSAGAAGVAGLPAVIFDAVMTFSAGRLTDDIALLAFRHAGAFLPER